MDLEIRTITPDEVETYLERGTLGFGNPYTRDELRAMAPTVEPNRVLATFDNGDMVGRVGVASVEMIVPGGSLRLGGISTVGVRQTYRRRGLMTLMMERQLRDMHERGEPLSALHASESIIYGRYGYGMASFHDSWTIQKHQTTLAYSPEVYGRVMFVGLEEAKQIFPEVYERACEQRQGMIKREAREWMRRMLDLNRGDRQYVYAIYERDGCPDGYVFYRASPSEQWLNVTELMAATDEAYVGLWQFCFGVDLITTINAEDRPVDEPLLWMLADPRLLRRTPCDSMWLRLVNVRTALSGRTYAAEGRVRFAVKDQCCPWNEGCWELEGGPDGAQCQQTSANPDLVLSAADLGAVYLGGVRFRTLVQAARVQEESSSAISRADAMFMTEFQPWGPFCF